MTGQSVDTARRLVDRLLGCGVTDAVLSPGSRSGPLALALHAADQQGLLRLHVRVDEREAGFLALGLAKVQRRIVPVVTTSGTAVANLHPAVLEALHAGVQVLAVTADRPGRLRGTGANQTTDQVGIFPGVSRLAAVGDLGMMDGPAHLNLEFDEPLIESTDWVFSADAPPVAQPTPPRIVRLDCVQRTVVVAGDGAGQQAVAVAEAAGWPVLAEPTSGARTGPNALASYRLLLQHAPIAGEIQRVVSFGHCTLSRPVTALLSRTDIDIVHIGDQTTFPVPANENVRFTDVVETDGIAMPEWLTKWRRADALASAAINNSLDGGTPLNVAAAVDTAVGHSGLLVIGSSSPVRDLDLIATAGTADREVMGNRGLAGIDGVLSTAIGAALARPGRAIAHVGDLTFLHGSNGLLIGPHEPRPDLTIVVSNDDGGSIFSTLEQGASDFAEAFERVYATPTGAGLAALCEGYGVSHRRVAVSELSDALTSTPQGIEVIEVEVDRAGRRDLMARISAAVAAALNSR